MPQKTGITHCPKCRFKLNVWTPKFCPECGKDPLISDDSRPWVYNEKEIQWHLFAKGDCVNAVCGAAPVPGSPYVSRSRPDNRQVVCDKCWEISSKNTVESLREKDNKMGFVLDFSGEKQEQKTMTDDEIIEIVSARKAGKKIERSDLNGQAWETITNPCWDFVHFRYRVKQEPAVIYANQCYDGLWNGPWMDKNNAKTYSRDTDIRVAVRFVETPE